MKNKNYELIDIKDFNHDSLQFLMEAHDKCEVCLQWIQRLIGEANETQTIKVAPPILSRVYNQLGNGIVNLNNARKITDFPIPFPLAQMIAFMLLFHWVITAFICAASVEQPFGDDANDLPLHEMQADLNRSLGALLDPLALHPPSFFFKQDHKQLRSRSETLEEIFANGTKKKQPPAMDHNSKGENPDNEKSSGNS